ncbi:MAG TPA: hypothetical protein VFT74_09800 [Isosphaeraceae bacterium]|nr:hypothetical protein [Isosphaeraceae bacterium]
MRQTSIPLPELALIAGTRAALGAGVGLLLARHLPEKTRNRVGWTLVGIGAITTVPLVFDVLRRSQPHPASAWIENRLDWPITRAE